MIPFLDLKTPHIELEEELVQVFREALRNAAFIGGPQVEAFENEFAEFCGTKYCVGVNSGTDALRFALIAAGIGPGDEVITVPNTFIATTEAISQAGATPSFVDIDERTYNMDPQKLKDYLRKRSAPSAGRHASRPKAVIPVHLYGQPADMDAILEIADQYHLIVIEDACQAHGAGYFSKKENRWKKAGSMGLAAAFSFYPGKNLGACGEGGAVTTNDEEIAQKVRMLRDHGQIKKYFHDMEGYNGRLDAIQAATLRIKLRHLSDWNEKRQQNAHRYNELFGQSDGVITPYEPSWTRAVYHLYIIRTSERDRLQQFLSQQAIGTGLHYPIPLHLQKAYSESRYTAGDFPISEKVASTILSLPMFPELTHHQQEFVVGRIKEFLSGE
ncbi:MAG: DegT/DnrJ/EryC1/StrS family aminotransferase [Deltaproteobacteria bacterium]|nr:DegT/DnrJ/EryC1/StrS family aminotransferase [Deltaproteobacteria bacterium]